MSIHYCKHCNQRYVTDEKCGDYVHICNSGNPTIDEEDITITGNWEDYSGSGTRAPQEVLRAGMVNELQGTRTQIEEGKDKEALTRRGERASTRRQRQVLTYINLKREGLD